MIFGENRKSSIFEKNPHLIRVYRSQQSLGKKDASAQVAYMSEQVYARSGSKDCQWKLLEGWKVPSCLLTREGGFDSNQNTHIGTPPLPFEQGRGGSIIRKKMKYNLSLFYK